MIMCKAQKGISPQPIKNRNNSFMKIINTFSKRYIANHLFALKIQITKQKLKKFYSTSLVLKLSARRDKKSGRNER